MIATKCAAINSGQRGAPWTRVFASTRTVKGMSLTAVMLTARLVAAKPRPLSMESMNTTWPGSAQIRGTVASPASQIEVDAAQKCPETNEGRGHDCPGEADRGSRSMRQAAPVIAWPRLSLHAGQPSMDRLRRAFRAVGAARPFAALASRTRQGFAFGGPRQCFLPLTVEIDEAELCLAVFGRLDDDLDRSTRCELAEQHFIGERPLHMFLDDAGQGPRAHLLS